MSGKPVERGRPQRASRLVAHPEQVATGMPPQPAPAVPVQRVEVAAHQEQDAFVYKFVNGQTPTLDDCERYIARLTTQWLLGIGRALAAIKDHELYRERGFRTFGDYIAAEQEWKSSYVSRIIGVVPVLEVLEAHGVARDVNEGQASALRPVFEEHQGPAVTEVWDATEGKRSARALEETARRLGYLPPASDSKTITGSVTPPSAMAFLGGALRPLLNLRKLRDVAQSGPEGAQLILAVLAAVADQMQGPAQAGSETAKTLLADIMTARAELEADASVEE